MNKNLCKIQPAASGSNLQAPKFVHSEKHEHYLEKNRAYETKLETSFKISKTSKS